MELTLFAEILELYLATACFHHGSSTEEEVVLQMRLARPEDDGDLLQNTRASATKTPETAETNLVLVLLHLLCTARAAHPTRRRPAKPPENEEKRAGSTHSTLKPL